MIKSILESLHIIKKKEEKKIEYPIRLETYGVMEYCPPGVHRTGSAYGKVTYIFADGVKRTYHKWYCGEFGIIIH